MLRSAHISLTVAASKTARAASVRAPVPERRSVA